METVTKDRQNDPLMGRSLSGEHINPFKAVVPQISRLSKSEYLRWIDKAENPRRCKSPRLFDSDMLENYATQAYWWTTCAFWVPIIAYILWDAHGCPTFHQEQKLVEESADETAFQFYLPMVSVTTSKTAMVSVMNTPALFFLGMFLWTFVEYSMHRWVFHWDEWLPNQPLCLLFHFFIHGIHHKYPHDHARLITPPTVSFPLGVLVGTVMYFLFVSSLHWMRQEELEVICAGGLVAFLIYDMWHYSLHHPPFTYSSLSSSSGPSESHHKTITGIGTKAPKQLLKRCYRYMRNHHLRHHYIHSLRSTNHHRRSERGKRRRNGNFGVTQPLWDWIFGTQLSSACSSPSSSPSD
jgi:sterol desaturase/sphingolipid hydroxylase (fatty acid hydroxylase superfamily)